MSEPYLGEIRLFAGNYVPVNWLACNGQLLDTGTYGTLFALLGVEYGGDGVNNFALPDLRGRIPVGQGMGKGLSNRVLGQSFGTEGVTLQSPQLPLHTHTLQVSAEAATQPVPTGGLLASSKAGLYLPATPPPGTLALAPSAITGDGGSEPHQNQMPFTALNFILSAAGSFPSRN